MLSLMHIKKVGCPAMLVVLVLSTPTGFLRASTQSNGG